MIYDFIDRSLGVIEEVLNTNVLLLKPKFQENERGEPYKTIVGFFLNDNLLIEENFYFHVRLTHLTNL